MNRRSSGRVPVIVLSGGLGCGKTTLLNHLLRHSRGRVGVVINDFGDVNVDAFLVEGQVDATATFSGGCLCCLSDPSELDDTLEALAAPRLDLDAIVVEASGLAEPRELARMILGSTAGRIRFGGVVEIVDATAWPSDGDDLPVAADHLRVASLLVVNKAESLTDAPEASTRLDDALARLAPGTPVVQTSFGRVDPDLLFDVADRDAPTGQLSFTDLLTEDAEHDHHAHEAYTSVSVESDLPASPRDLVAFLEHRADGILRVKGRTWLDLPGHRGQYVVQAVGGWLAFERRPWPAGTEPTTQLVAIGTGMDDDAVEAALRGCLTSEPVPADHAYAMTRYTR